MMPPAYERFRAELAGALDERFHTIEWLDCQVFNGNIRVIGNERAVILFQFEKYPTGWLELQGMAAAGDLGSIKCELIPAAEELAKAMGCGTTEIESREGWSRTLKDHGYEVYQVKIKKAL